MKSKAPIRADISVPKVLKVMGDEALRRGKDRLTPRQINQIIREIREGRMRANGVVRNIRSSEM